ncbi:uncharacterized protein LOC116342004 [Contarinia nasturtii]|uniref:uncharacterized protein LOC116342004 n=1 Tax=Contarinia nasturtii TaxID=265458 RepID=UPI0012D42219|nr:uncharacterized protein LOC116342004 [Contarinia nasturtii]
MNTEKELRKWLNRPDFSFVDNLSFGIKVWNSIEFVLLTKQEIVVDEFCNNLTKLRDEINRSSDPKCGDVAWEKINEFLNFRYSSGAVSVAVKDKLVKTLSQEAEISINESNASHLILNALLVTLQNTSIQNYYKSNAVEFARFLGLNIRYVTVLLDSEEAIEQIKTYKEHIDQLFTALKAFIKQTPFLDEFKSAFATEILTALCELVILSQRRQIVAKQELLSILQELYFDGNQTNELKKYLNGAKTKFPTFHEIFAKPMHVFLTVVEALVWSFRNDEDVRKAFLRYLFNETDGRFRIQSGESIQTQLHGVTVCMFLLKKYDVPMHFQIDSNRAATYLGHQIEFFFNSYHTNHTYEVLNLLCATLKLDPLILEYSVCQIAVKFMLLPKKDESIWNKYEEFMFLMIEMYRKMSRSEKFISQLIKNLYETVSKVKLSKKLKRSFNSSFVEGSTPSKKLKNSVDDDISMDGSVIERSVSENRYVTMFEENILTECENLVTKSVWKQNIQNSQIWSDIAFAFTPAISSTYTRFISNLVSRPSLVVWKTLNFTLKDYVQQLKDADGKCSENCIFLIEITCALLSQYFMGSRLAEQSDKSWNEIEANRNATRDILTEFGHAILNQEHNYRTMNAFLKLCYSASNFDLLVWYYRPDSMGVDGEESKKFDVENSAKKLLSYLNEKEWITIQQRITNFGKRECKANINKIYLQRLKTSQLFELEKADEVDISKYVLSTAFKDIEQIADILNDSSLCSWFIGNLNAKQKQIVCELLLQSTSEFNTLNRLCCINDWQFIESLTVATYKQLIEILAVGKHSEYLSEINFDAIFERKFKKASKELGVIIEKQCNEPKYADKKHIQKQREHIMDLVGLLNNLPVGFGKADAKSIISALHVIVYRYLSVGGDEELSNIAVNIFKAILHFGESPNVFANLKIKTLITIFKDENSVQSIFALIFERTCRDINIENAKVLDELYELLQQFETNDQSQQKILLQIAVLVVGDLSKDKKNRVHCDRFRDIVFGIIKTVSKDKKNGGWLIGATLPAFVIIVKAYIAANKAKEEKDSDEQTIQLIKLFLKNSVDCMNQHSVRLLNTALENKAYLGLTDEEIKELVAKYWLDFKMACGNSHDVATNKTLNSALKIICDHKSIDEWIKLLTEVEKEIESSIFSDQSKQQSKILASMANCQYNKNKGQIFTGFFKTVTRQINLTIRARTTDLTQNFDWILNLLECYTILTNNVQTPVSVELIDDVLAFLAEINIKKIDAEKFDSDQFKSLLEQMCALVLGLIQHRSVFIMDRVPHFSNVFKDLLQTICWYKSNRSQQTQLEQAEITMLAEMAHSLEKTNKTFVKHSAEVKRVAPYLLLFAINMMIGNDRPTTLYSKIKTHIEYICYDLIAVCDHRTEGYILRSCNEASKAIYESLHRDYRKYFKFKGKV